MQKLRKVGAGRGRDAGNDAGSMSAGASQQAVIDFLLSPAAFGDETAQVDVITTHGAKVFLGKHDVYKIKQAVKYDYMDFSTLDRRRAICEREFEINKPATPQIYRGVVAITRNAEGQFEIGGKGDPVEWAVHMNRFREEDSLESIAENGGLDAGLGPSRQADRRLPSRPGTC